MNCEFCQNRGGEWIQARVFRKRTFIFRFCPHCHKSMEQKAGQVLDDFM